MDMPRLIVATAVLVAASLWAVVLLDYLQVWGVIVVLIAPFVVLLSAGVYGVMGALWSGPGRDGRRAEPAGREVGTLALTVLRMLAQGKSKQEIVSATAVSPSVIEAKIEALTKGGLVVDNALSEKGFELLNRSKAASS